MGDRQREKLLQLARQRAKEHPVELERALQEGMRAFRRRVALTYTVTCAIAVCVALLLGASVAAAGRDPVKTPDKITLESLVVKPRTQVLVPGETQPFAALATFSDRSTLRVTREVEWRSSSPVITIDTRGRASAVSTGEATVTARWGAMTGSADVTVTKAGALLRSIAVKPSERELQPDQTQRFRAVATYRNGTSRDITQKVNWHTSDPATLTIDDSGRATGLSAGDVTISAELGKRRGVAMVRVTEADVVLMRISIKPRGFALRQGERTTFVATGHYSNDTSRDISREVDWTSADLKTMAIEQDGRATAISQGVTTIRATLGSRSASADVTVRALPRVLTGVEVSPPTSRWCGESATQQLTATAVYDDGKKEQLTGGQVRWSSSDERVATVDGTGFVSSPENKSNEPASVSAEFEGVVGAARFSCPPVD